MYIDYAFHTMFIYAAEQSKKNSLNPRDLREHEEEVESGEGNVTLVFPVFRIRKTGTIFPKHCFPTIAKEKVLIAHDLEKGLMPGF